MELAGGEAGTETGTDGGKGKRERGHGRDGDMAGRGMRKMGNAAVGLTRQR